MFNFYNNLSSQAGKEWREDPRESETSLYLQICSQWKENSSRVTSVGAISL